jgi:hypothetical protein
VGTRGFASTPTTRGSQRQHGHGGSDPLAETAKQAPAPLLVWKPTPATRSRKRQNKRQHIRGDSWKRQHAQYSWKPTPARPRGERPARGNGKTSASTSVGTRGNASTPTTMSEMCEVSDAVRTLGREVPPSRARDPRPRGEEPQPSSESSQETTRLNRVTSSM